MVIRTFITLKLKSSVGFTFYLLSMAPTNRIYYKLYLPNGTLSTGTNSPSGYSTSKSLYIYSGTRDYELIGWGADNAGNWKSGTYKYEFYCNDVYLGFYNFTIK